MQNLHLIIIVMLYGNFNEAERTLPAFVKICSRKDPNLSSCWKESIVSILPRMNKGIPEMGLRPIEPVVVDKLNLDFGGLQSMNLQVTMKNVSLHGCSNMKVIDVSVVFTENSGVVEQNLTLPHLYLTSDMKAVGHALLLTFDTTGQFIGNISNIDVTGFWKSKNVIKNGKVHGVIEESFVKVNIGTVHVEFDKILGDNKDINDNINKIVNENIDVLYDEMRPVIESVIDQIVKEAINKVYDLFPMDVLYPV